MSKKQLLLLFLGSVVPWTIGNGILPLLPIYALELGASEAIAGYYLAFSFLALAAGSVIGGWLADRFQRRKLLLVISGLTMIPSLWLMGEARNVLQLSGATAAVWFSVGVSFPVFSIIAGLFSDKQERGRVLGIIAMANGLGSIVGGLVVGPMVDQWGYAAMFLALCLFTLALPLIALFIKDKRVDRAPVDSAQERTGQTRFGRAFYLLLLAHLVVIIINAIAPMGRSLVMNDLGFTATAITSTLVISGVVSLPFPFIIGWLSDRLGRKRMMVICYSGYAVSMVVLAVSTSLWHFWIAVILLKVGMVSMNVGAAFVTDLVDPKALGRGVATFQCMGWLAFSVGYVVAGNAFQQFGVPMTSIVSTGLAVIGIVLIVLIRTARARQEKPLSAGFPVA